MNVWKKFLEEQKKILGQEAFDRWLIGLEVLSFDARNLYLQAKDLFQETWFKDQILPKLHLKNENGHPIKVHIGSKTNKKKVEIEERKLTFESSAITTGITFSTLFQYHGNEEAFRVLQALTQQQSTSSTMEPAQFNPIVLVGAKNSGKSSLLHATANAFEKQGRNLIFVDAGKFAEHVVSAIRQFQMKEFRTVYRKTDILIVDGIDIFASKNATQEEFFHTFNTLHLHKKQIIVSCTQPPKNLSLEPRIISRLEWGLILSIKKPSAESIQRYLLWKESKLGISLCSKSHEWILERSHGSLKKIDLFFELLIWKYEKKKFVYPEIEELLQKCFSQEVTADLIVKKTAQYFQLDPKELLGKSQKKEISFSRQIAMYLCRKILRMPFQKIGIFFARDHSTAMNGVSQIEKQIEAKSSELLRILGSIQENLDKTVSL